MKIKKSYVLSMVVGCMLLGFLLRAYALTQAPKGALIDELHFGYLAYSLIETGKDEHGIAWPLIFKGFGDEKLPAYAYASIPFVAFLGPEVLAFRLPSLIAGTALIGLMYWLSREVGLRKKWSLFVAFVTAVSPWSFFLSRIGFESNFALAWYTAALAALLRGVKTAQTSWLVAASMLLSVSWYSYIAFRPVSAVLLLLFLGFAVWHKHISAKQFGIALVAFILCVMPLFAPSVVGVNNTRLKQVGIFNDVGITLKVNENRTFCDMQFPRTVCDLAFNKGTLVARELIDRYFTVFSPQFLATKGEADIVFLTVKGFGQIYPILYPLFLLGLVGIFYRKKKMPRYLVVLLLAGLLVSPLPTIMAGDAQKVRISTLLPFIFLTIGVGVAYLDELLQKKYLQLGAFVVLLLGTVGFSFLYFVEYFTVHTVQNEHHYQSYLPEMYAFISTLDESTLVTIKPFYSDPLMFYAFYTKMSPSEYQKKAVLGKLEDSGFQHTVELGNIRALDRSLEHVGCEGHTQGVQSVLVTNEDISGAVVLYRGLSTNKVDTYVFVYDATQSTDSLKCSESS